MEAQAVSTPSPRAGPEDGPLLRLEGLGRRFGTRTVLDGLSFEVQRGEVFGLLGPNGAGKSTAFAILAGLLRANSGQLFWAGQSRQMTDPSFRAELGLIFQRSTLDDALTARENLALGGKLYALSGSGLRQRIEEMLSLIELQDRGDEKVSTWSGGMRRRLELVRALMHRPRLLLMDEPTQGLDEAAFRKFWAHLRHLRSTQGLTVVLTTHRAEEAAECDRLAILDGGKRVALDSPAALSSRVGGDVVTLEGESPEALAQEIIAKLGLPARVVDGQVRVEQRDGHTLIPRLVEALGAGRLKAVHLRRPTLADVFLQLTGKGLGDDLPLAEPVTKKRK
jgi:ABC-2 type transport system ATP-binding protein